ncbi:uncharacterized protein N7458_009994 [Penicillium daleae]|uniref:RING-type domain-containing protein n=1 Tax=Penicillium daleae TaxID=63821 RepID=A0AAD6C0A6_9EURO|nr:uncharacterized protein N7458_009994 [Penicillium daleae]KAJ5438996.1 hypothetical protein N7458_009994 [Penicillium daleae]
MTGENLPQALCQCEFIDRARTRLGCAPLHAGEHSGTLVRAILTSWISSVSMIMWYHRRHAAARATNEDHDLASPMQQTSVEQWLEEQNAPSYVGQYSHETCPICLSSLSSSPYLVFPEPARLPHGQRKLSNCVSGEYSYSGAKDSRRHSGILVLNRCHHAFHTACLASWFEYQRYSCPICQASYSPADTVQ